MTYQWKTIRDGNPVPQQALSLPGGLTLTVMPTVFKPNAADPAFDFCLFQEKYGMQACLWCKDRVPAADVEAAKAMAPGLALAGAEERAKQAAAVRDALADAVEALAED